MHHRELHIYACATPMVLLVVEEKIVVCVMLICMLMCKRYKKMKNM